MFKKNRTQYTKGLLITCNLNKIINKFQKVNPEHKRRPSTKRTDEIAPIMVLVMKFIFMFWEMIISTTDDRTLTKQAQSAKKYVTVKGKKDTNEKLFEWEKPTDNERLTNSLQRVQTVWLTVRTDE